MEEITIEETDSIKTLKHITFLENNLVSRIEPINSKNISEILEEWPHLKTINGISFEFKLRKGKKNLDYMPKRLNRIIISKKVENDSMFETIQKITEILGDTGTILYKVIYLFNLLIVIIEY